MAFTKFASLEQTQVLGIKGSEAKVHTASLDRFSEFENYKTSDGYLYVRLKAQSSRINRNGDGWPSVELAGGPEAWKKYTQNGKTSSVTVHASEDARYGFSTFLHKPVFVDHNNSNPARARGVVVDAKLHVEDSKTSSHDAYYSSKDVDPEHLPPTWIELLVEVDAKSFPRLAKAIMEGGKDSSRGIDGWSMGCNVEKTSCSICSNVATEPEDFCKHVKLKGAHFDAYDKLGRKTSKKAYENCYGVQYFEISAVFDPADETALTREVRSSVEGEEANVWKFADHPSPQKDLLSAPDHVDTLRSDDACPLCGSEMDGPKCKVCDYSKPPDGFDNPDLAKLHPEIDAERRGEPEEEKEEDPVTQAENAPLHSEVGPAQDNATNVMASTAIKGDMSGWNLSVHPKVAGRINITERPIRPQGPVSGEPTEVVLSDQAQPIQTRTASDMIAAATKETTMKVADAASGAPAAAEPQVRGDVEGVGGYEEDSNEEASKPRGRHNDMGQPDGGATVDVEAIGGTGVEKTDAAEHDHVDHGDEYTKTTDDSGPTKTWGQGTGVEHQEDAVSRKPFPDSDEGVKKSAEEKLAYDSEPFPHDDGGLAGGDAVKGNKPIAEQFGDRVNVLEPTTTPSNNSGPTKTWSGTDGNKINHQQEPVTKDSLEGNDIVNLHSSKHLFSAFKLADTEVDLGLIEKPDKYNRVAELQELTPAELEAEARVVSRVKSSGIRRTATKQGGVGRLPSMRPSQQKEASSESSEADESLFL